MKCFVVIRAISDPNDNDEIIAIDGGQVVDMGKTKIINPWDLHAIEAAVRLKEKVGGQVVALSLGSGTARKALKKALAAGCDNVVLVNCSDSFFYDVNLAADILSEAIKYIGIPDIIFGGKIFADSNNATLLCKLSAILKFKYISEITNIAPTTDSESIIEIVRVVNGNEEFLETSTPLVLTVSKEFGEPRYPSFIALQKAYKSDITEYTLEELDILPKDGRITFMSIEPNEMRRTQCEFITGETAKEKAQILINKLNI